MSFSDDDLRGIAERYDPALHEAPLIVGHPQHDAPAFGWIKSLSFADGRLQATEHQVAPEFAKARKQGAYKKLSARFFTPGSPNNPTPGHYYLRDVGFLGALTPAVKGLRTYAFGDDASSQVATAELSFADLPAHGGSAIARLFGRLRDWLIDQSGTEAAERILPANEVEALRALAQHAAESSDHPDPAAAPGLRSFADAPATPQEPPPMTDAEKAELEAARQKAADLEAENARLKAAQAAAEQASRALENASFADALIQAGRWPSGHRDVLVATLNHLGAPAGGADCVSFGDGDAAQPLHQALRTSLQQLPECIAFGDVATKARAAKPAHGLNKSDREIAEAARAWKASEEKAGRHVSFADAVRHVTTQEEPTA